MFQPIAGQKTFGPDFPSYEALAGCIRCGRCLPVCPTYQETTLETQSPRGRLSLLRAVEDGKLDLEEPGLEAHLYHCLDCRACNTVCPAGIPIGELIVQGRAAVEHVHRRNWLVRFGLNVVLVSPRRAEFFAAPIRLLQKLKLDRLGVLLLGWIPKLGPMLRDLVQMAPELTRPLRSELTKSRRVIARRVAPKQSRPKAGIASRPSTTPLRDSAQDARNDMSPKVGFFLGCVMNVAFAGASRASVELMAHFGCEVVTPKDQLCCGAPHDDQGMKDRARAFARRNIAAFERMGDLDAIVADCAACSGFLKEYGHLLHDDPEWRERAKAFALKVRDVTEWLDEIMPLRSEPSLEETNVSHRSEAEWGSKGAAVVTYHEPCHLANVQGVRRQPRALLARLQNAELRELPDAARCCGSAGIYNLTHPSLSKQLLDRKMAEVVDSGVDVVVSANPGCLLQLDWGKRRHKLPVMVKHISEFIWEGWVGTET